ncbi:MAG: 6-carboxytetrahydropterin synthase, partial [Polyangiaceae bacterium]|nr:6-carboxytetrahydropterin synthase [Polyangiaceae bacterium]
MFTLTIRDYLKCAHSLKGEIFGPAQLMHVITYEVEAVFMTSELDEYGLIVDFASTQSALQEILSVMNFKNLDEVPQLNGKNTTTEFLCQYIHAHIVNRVVDQFKGSLRVTLRESAVAEVSFEGPVVRKLDSPPTEVGGSDLPGFR